MNKRCRFPWGSIKIQLAAFKLFTLSFAPPFPYLIQEHRVSGPGCMVSPSRERKHTGAGPTPARVRGGPGGRRAPR